MSKADDVATHDQGCSDQEFSQMTVEPSVLLCYTVDGWIDSGGHARIAVDGNKV